MNYKYLLFKPAILDLKSSNVSSGTILLKAQLIKPARLNSISSVLLSDNIEVNNRRTLEEWERLLEDNGFKFEKNFDHDHCKGYVIFDLDYTTYEFQLFSCDINSSDLKVEVCEDYIHPLLFILDLKKEGVIFPASLKNKINSAKEKLTLTDNANFVNKNVLNQLHVLDKLVDHCQDYEVDILYSILDY